MERIKFFDDTIAMVKNKFKPDDIPEAFILKDGKLTISIIAVEKPYQVKMTLGCMQILYGDDCEIVFAQEGWYSKDTKSDKQVKDRKGSKTAVFIFYFSKDKSLMNLLEYKMVKGKVKWVEKYDYAKGENQDYPLNPFKFKKEDIQKWLVWSEQDIMRQEGKTEERNLLKGFKMKIYTHKNKMFFEVFNAKGEVFFETKPKEYTQKVYERIDICAKALSGDKDAFEKMKELMEQSQEPHSKSMGHR